MKADLKLIAPLVILAGLLALFGKGIYDKQFSDNPDAVPSTFVGRPAPVFDLEPLGDLPHATREDLQAEGWKLVNFWASWCPPCRAEHPQLTKLATEDGWTILGVNKSDTEANALAFLGELGDPYTAHAADPTGRQAIEWGVYGLPETFLIDPEGNIRYRYPGPITARIWERAFLPVVTQLGAKN